MKNRWLASRRRIIIAATIIALIPLTYGTYYVVNQHHAQAPLLAPPTEVKGSTVTLKLLNESHYIDYHNMFSDTVRKGLEFPEHITLNYTIRYLQAEQRKMETGKLIFYCIFDNHDNTLIGEVNIRELNDVDPGQMGCWVNESYWGGGRFQEALKLCSDVYFKLHPYEKSYIAHVRLWNKRSYYALKKFGFEDVGYFYEDGKPSRYILEYKKK